MRDCVVEIASRRYTFFYIEDVKEFRLKISSDRFIAKPEDKVKALKILDDYIAEHDAPKVRKEPLVEDIEEKPAKPAKKKHAKK